MTRLEGKVCVVTGATGMAADAARRFAAEGAEVWVVARDPAQEARIEAILARMSVEEKVGQIIQPDISSVTPDEVRAATGAPLL